MLKIIAILTGGGLGATCRYILFLVVQKFAGLSFPAGTLAANLIGSLLIGFLWCIFEGTRLTHEWRLFLFTGVLGGFTTFSTYTRETTQLIKVGDWKSAVVYITCSNVLGIALVFAGYFFARRLMPFPKL